MISVRVLTEDDWRIWRELRLAALDEAPYAFGSTLPEWSGPGDTEPRWRGRLRDVPFNVVVNRDGEAVGMASGTATSTQGWVELISMWVAPHARGGGVGDAAINAVVDWANSRGSPVALAVKEGNAAAIALYRRHGFVDVGPMPDEQGERCMRRGAVDAPGDQSTGR